MKIAKKIMALTLIITLVTSISLMVYAATKTVTKSTDICTLKFQYETYVDKKGIKKVKNGKVVSVKGKSSSFGKWEYVPKSTKVSLIDGGRTYLVKVNGTMYHYLTPDYVHTFESVIKESKTVSFEFCYSTK